MLQENVAMLSVKMPILWIMLSTASKQTDQKSTTSTPTLETKMIIVPSIAQILILKKRPKRNAADSTVWEEQNLKFRSVSCLLI